MRTRGTKTTESSSESFTLNMKPRPNMQLAAACCVCCALFLGKSVNWSPGWAVHVTLGAAGQEGKGGGVVVVVGVSVRL